MDCMICSRSSTYYFSKRYTEAPFDAFMREIGEVAYRRCDHCGFVFSETHARLHSRDWGRLNEQFHHYNENPDSPINQPPYAEQAMMLALLRQHGLIAADGMLDYAAGYGSLSRLMARYFHLPLPIYDPYVHAPDLDCYVDEPHPGSYRTVINSAMFEHVLTRRDLDRVHELVAPDGCLVLHTVVCENVPCDSDWFYLRPPVHVAFHTNKSMNILMQQWGYQSSIYCPPSKCWVLLRQPWAQVQAKVEAVNRELQSTWLVGKDGFMDYWKGF